MRKITFTLLCLLNLSAAWSQRFSFEDIKSYPFPNELTAARTGSRIAWAMNEQGLRNVYAAEAPDFKPVKLTNFSIDDGQEITSLMLSNDGAYAVFVRGGDHGSNYDTESGVNPMSATVAATIQIWVVPFRGGTPTMIGEGDDPAISPNNKQVAYIKNGQVWLASLNGSAKPTKLLQAKGSCGSLQWNTAGDKLAFVSNRGDHSMIGIFTDSLQPIQWIAPSFYKDAMPRWSPNGRSNCFCSYTRFGRSAG